jgi:chromosomal replication initiator protein
MDSVWPRCLERLEAELSAEDVHTWLKPLQASPRPDGLTLYAPNAFVVDIVRERYLARIRELTGHYAGREADVTLEVGSLRRESIPAISIRTTRSRRSSRAAATSSAWPPRARSR